MIRRKDVVVTCQACFTGEVVHLLFALCSLFFLSEYQFIHVGVTMTIALCIFSLKGVMFSSLNIGRRRGYILNIKYFKTGKSDSMAQVSKNVSPNKMALNLKSFSEDGLGQFYFYENCFQSFKEPCLGQK